MDHTVPENRQVNNTLCCLYTLKQGPCLHLAPAGRMVGRPGFALHKTNRCQRVQTYYSNGVLQNQGKCAYFWRFVAILSIILRICMKISRRRYMGDKWGRAVICAGRRIVYRRVC